MTIIRRLFAYVAALARDLSDETAYAKHLQWTGRAHSAAEWRAFIDRKHQRKYQNVKCC
jgi:hypothetical protein